MRQATLDDLLTTEERHLAARLFLAGEASEAEAVRLVLRRRPKRAPTADDAATEGIAHADGFSMHLRRAPQPVTPDD